MKRLICTVSVLLALCVPARADDGLSMDEAMGIILDHHGVETEMDVSGYLTLYAEARGTGLADPPIPPILQRE